MVSTRRPLGRELGPLNVAELASFTAAILFYPITNLYHQNALFSVIWFTTWLLMCDFLNFQEIGRHVCLHGLSL